jgi:hypothetical protein
MKFLLTVVFTITFVTATFGQSPLEKKIQLDSGVSSLENILSEIEKKCGVTFMYSNVINPQKVVSITSDEMTVKAWLDKLFDGSVRYNVSRSKIILRPAERIGKSSGDNMTLHGYVYDSLSGEVLNGASIVVEELSTGISTNPYGFFSLTIPTGTYQVRISHVGYKSNACTVTPESVDLHASLMPSTHELQQVDVNGNEDLNVIGSEPGNLKLNSETISKIPALAGEVDVLRALQFLPGVKNSSELSTGLSVRGGNLDQNMILLDEAPVYNPSHVIGVFSVFNSDAIKDVQLYKGFIPANYGGRLSSVLDVRMKEGNKNRTTLTGGIGTISSRLTVEGPYLAKRGSFLVSSRYTYSDALTRTLKFMRDNKFRFYFYDINGKGSYSLNRNNRIFLSFYSGEDVNRLGILSDVKWKNATATLRWNHTFNEKLFSNTTLLYSNYKYTIRAGHINPFSWKSGIRDVTFKSDLTYFLNPSNILAFGFSSTHHEINPGSTKAAQLNSMLETGTIKALEHAVYARNEQTIGSWIIQYGLRYSLFQNLGEATVFNYNNDHEVTDTTFHSGGVYHSSGGFEPRLALRYMINSSSAVKASYTRTYQYLQLLSNSSFGLSPFDTWFPSRRNIAPQKADQASIGFFKNLKQNLIEVSAEVYYRWLYNQSDYANHAQLLFNPQLESELRFGKGNAYGAELLVRKNSGRLNGWFSYTYARTKKLIPEISSNYFNANYDQPHSASIVVNYKLSPRVELSCDWVFATGRPTTLPVESYGYGDHQVPVYSERNSVRLPDYHRLDVSLTLHSKVRPGKRSSHDWVFSVYNVYARKNPMMVFISRPFADFKSETGMDSYQISILPFFPSITYNFKL